MMVIGLYYSTTWILWAYDSNKDDILQKSEVVDAVQDYFNGLIEQWHLMEVIIIYYNQSPLYSDYDATEPFGEFTKPEVINAITDYFYGILAYEELIIVCFVE